MTPERWQQVKTVLDAALAREPQERLAFIGKACAGDEPLRKELESLIISDEQAGNFIEQPAVASLAEIITAKGELLVNHTLGSYEVQALLGAGGMGEVYLAEDTRLGRRIALKVLPAHLSADQDRLRRFQQEARAASSLNHPNILTIYEVGEAKDRPFIATEFIEGETLRQRMTDGRLELSDAIDISRQVASALSAAHAAGIVHRDIKPENIMVRGDGFVKVLDFGLVKLTERPATDSEASTLVNTHAGVVMGTAHYMSPEQARGLDIDARTDIWSLGVVLYEMVAGCSPFDRPTPNEVIALILEREPTPLSRYAREVPIELERIVGKAMTKDREQRYQTANELLVDLRHLQHRLEIDAEIDRSASSESGQFEKAGTNEQPTARKTSSVEYLIGEIKNHQIGAIITLLVVVLLTAIGFDYWFYSRPVSTAAQIESIAVLPLVNAGNDPETEYLSDGITESLINSLSQIQRLNVVARMTAFRYKNKEIDPQAVGRELGVQAILTGKLNQRGDTLVLQVDLIETNKGSQVWGAQYDRKTSDLLAVRQELAREITEKLRLRLRGEDEKRMTRGDAANPQAYQFYLKGRYFWNKRTAANLNKAIEQFQQAIDKDPNYALAYVGLADSYGLLELYASTPSSETLPKARAAADRALQIDNLLAEAHASLGLIEQYSWNFSATEREYKRAIELNPNDPTAHLFYGFYLHMVRGRFDEAMTEIRRAQQLDPLSPYIGINLATIYAAKGELDAAIEEAKKILELDPNFLGAHAALSLVYRRQGRLAEAIGEAEKGVRPDRSAANSPNLGVCYAVAGKRAKARAILKKVKEQYSRHEANGQEIAEIYATLGEKDQAFAWLEKDFQARTGSLAFIAYDAGRYNLREALSGDPRWNDLLRRIGLLQN